MGVSVFGRLNYLANSTAVIARETTAVSFRLRRMPSSVMYYFAANKWTFLRKKSVVDGHERAPITDRLAHFLKRAMVATHEDAMKKYFFSHKEYAHDLTEEKACHILMKVDQVPELIRAQSNASNIHAYFMCDDICCGTECCEINPNFLLLIVSLCISLTLGWLFCCVIFLKWRRPAGKRNYASDYIEIPLTRSQSLSHGKERTPQQYRTRPARSAQKVRRNDEYETNETILSS